MLPFLVPAPVISIREHPIPYNGTIFTLGGIAVLDRHIDTNITAMGVWSNSDNIQVTTAPPYLAVLEFYPLASDNSRIYTLNVTILPSNASPFIAASSSSIIYDLIVQRKFPQFRC